MAHASVVLALTATVLATLTVAAQSPASSQTASTVHTAVLQGTVVRSDSNAPIAGARIVAARVGGPVGEYRTTTADDGGRFSIRDLVSGTYRVFAEHENYLQAEYGKKLVGLTGSPVTVTDNTTASPITIVMTPPGAIAGRVIDRGRPAPLVVIRALKAMFIDGDQPFRSTTWTQTDDRGEYRLFGLTPGLYYVSATPPPKPRVNGQTLDMPVIPSSANGNRSLISRPLSIDTPPADAFDNFMYPPSLLPGTTDLSLASFVDVQAGQTAQAVPLSLVRAAPVTVRGRVIGESDGLPVPGIRVGISPIPVGLSSLTDSIATDAEGRFALGRAAPGSNLVVAQVDGEIRRSGYARIDVGDRDVDGVTVTLGTGTAVTGRVLLDGQPPTAADRGISIQLYGGIGPSGSSVIRFEPDGTFTMPNVIPRTYHVRASFGNRALYTKSIRYGGQDVTFSDVTIEGEQRGLVLEVELSSKTATAEVQVVDAQRRPVPGALVVAVPDAARRNRSAFFKTATADEQGRARIQGLAPGEYRLFATADIEVAAWQDPAIIKRYESRGEVVRLTEGGSASATVRILR